MLVLSRRVRDTILFPDLGVTIEVLQVKGNTVRVGVDAPLEIKVLRGELGDKPPALTRSFSLSGDSEHEIRNKLNTLTLASALARKMIEKGQYNQAASRLDQALQELSSESNSEPNFDAEAEVSALIVEDVENEREMLAGFLRLHGIGVSTVPDGEQAVDYLESNRKPNFMMVDIGLPGKSGRDLILEVRNNPAFDNVKLFAISGKTPQQANIDPAQNRISKWFQKPLKPSRLIAEIESSLSAPQITG